MNPLLIGALLLALLALSCGGGEAPQPQPKLELPIELTSLPQGWGEAEMQGFWFTPQGSHLIPYDWFLALEQASSEELFRSNEHLDRLRFIPAPPGPWNPDGLPIGFTKEPGLTESEAFVGMTCAACHTGRIDFEGKQMLIDGGPALHDFNTFLDEMLAAMQATVADEAKLARLAERLGESDVAALRGRLTETTDALAARVALNKPDHPAGFARVDAFGNIFNEVSTTFLGVPENGMPPNAPVSFPPLWDTPQHDRVQWNGSAINAGAGPLVRNAGEVMGVFGSLDFKPLPGGAGYASTVRTADLERLEDWITDLESPQWPADLLPPIDAEKSQAGAAIYEQTCAGCHPHIERADPARTVKATMVPLTKVGTDPAMAAQFGRRSKTGQLQGRKGAFVAGPALGPEAPTGLLVVNGVIGSLVGARVEGLPDLLQTYFATRASMTPEPPSYKARPLNGVWATAPYLHNGSAPTLRAMLTSPDERPKTFRLGSREFDPVAVGFRDEGSFVYDTSLPGNSNQGHPFGTDLDAAAKDQLIEYLKTL